MAAVLDALQRNTEQGHHHNHSPYAVKSGGGSSATTGSNSIYSPVVVAQYNHVREFHKLMVQWVAEPLQFPFASRWVAVLTNIEGVDERTAHRMLVEQVDRAHQHYPTLFQMPKGVPSKSREVSLRIGSVTNTTSELPSDSAQLEEALVTHLSATYLCMRTLLNSASSSSTGPTSGGGELHRRSVAAPPSSFGQAVAAEVLVPQAHPSGTSGAPVEGDADGAAVGVAAVAQVVRSSEDDAMVDAVERGGMEPLALQPTPVDLGGVGLAKPPTAPKRLLHSAPSAATRRSLIGGGSCGGDTAAASQIVVDMNIARSVCRPGGSSARTSAPAIVEVVQQVLSAHQDLAAAAAVQPQQPALFKPNTQAIESVFSVERMKEIRQRLELQALQQQRQNELIESLRSPRSSMREVRSGGPLATTAAYGAAGSTTSSSGQGLGAGALPPTTAAAAGGVRIATRPHTARAALATHTAQSAQQRRLVLGSTSTRAQATTGTVESVSSDGVAETSGAAAVTSNPHPSPRPIMLQGPKSLWASRILLPMSTTSHQTVSSSFAAPVV